VSIEHYIIENNHGPERILFYRDGMSDGHFPRANDEIASIRAAAKEQLQSPIPITFVICQSQQLGFRMVPSVQTFNNRGTPNTNCLRQVLAAFHFIQLLSGLTIFPFLCAVVGQCWNVGPTVFT